MPSIIDNSSVANISAMPTPQSLKPGAEHVNNTPVGPAAISSATKVGFTAVESAQMAAEQSYSAMASASAGGGQDPTVEIMLEQSGKSL